LDNEVPAAKVDDFCISTRVGATLDRWSARRYPHKAIIT